jgi:hypothetical protein
MVTLTSSPVRAERHSKRFGLGNTVVIAAPVSQCTRRKRPDRGPAPKFFYGQPGPLDQSYFSTLMSLTIGYRQDVNLSECGRD